MTDDEVWATAKLMFNIGRPADDSSLTEVMDFLEFIPVIDLAFWQEDNKSFEDKMDAIIKELRRYFLEIYFDIEGWILRNFNPVYRNKKELKNYIESLRLHYNYAAIDAIKKFREEYLLTDEGKDAIKEILLTFGVEQLRPRVYHNG